MDIALSELNIVVNIGTLIVLFGFAFKQGVKITKFKEDTYNKINFLKDRSLLYEKKFNEHEKQEREHNLAERLARIETDIQRIRSALSKKKNNN